LHITRLTSLVYTYKNNKCFLFQCEIWWSMWDLPSVMTTTKTRMTVHFLDFFGLCSSFSLRSARVYHRRYLTTLTHTLPFYGPLFRTTQVGWYQNRPVPENINLDFKRCGEDNRGKCVDNPTGCHSIRTIDAPTSIIFPVLRRMPFLPQPSKFILAWGRHQICWIAYLEAQLLKLIIFLHLVTVLKFTAIWFSTNFCLFLLPCQHFVVNFFDWVVSELRC